LSFPGGARRRNAKTLLERVEVSVPFSTDRGQNRASALSEKRGNEENSKCPRSPSDRWSETIWTSRYWLEIVHALTKRNCSPSPFEERKRKG
jgi:hypothetical protein